MHAQDVRAAEDCRGVGGSGCSFRGVIPGLRSETCHPSEHRPLAGDPDWGTRVAGNPESLSERAGEEALA